MPNLQQSGRLFAILSASGTIHTPHADANGMATFLLIHQGFKYVIVGVYTGETMPDFPDPLGGLWTILEMPGLTIVAFVAGPRDVV